MNGYINGIEDDQKIQKDTTEDEDTVNPSTVKAKSITGFDYDKLIGELNELIVEVEMISMLCLQVSFFLLLYTF
jgi:hypothetical protein